LLSATLCTSSATAIKDRQTMDLLGNYSSDEDKDKSDEEELESPKKLSTTRKSDTDKDRSDDEEEELEPPKQLPTTRKDVTKETKNEAIKYICS
jgi:hypothetical protein